MKRIKTSEIKTYREQYLKAQLGLCGLCQEPIPSGQEVLDHCHRRGNLRKTLHRGCNCFLGNIENNLKRNQITPERLLNILRVFRDYVDDLKEEIHPTHLTQEERAQRAKKRAQAKRKKK